MSSNGPTSDNKSDLLFKEFTGVVNDRQDLPFTGQNYPFRNFVMNKEIFSYDIPKDLSNVTFIDGQDIYYGRQALDFSFNNNNTISMDSSYIIPGTNLKFYYKLGLQQANTGTNRTWYYDDGTGEKNSLLRDTIPFRFDASYTSYTQALYVNSGNNSVGMNASPIYWLLDYKSGFVQFYGEESAVNTWVNNHGPPRFSFIKYIGDKGAGGGSNSAIIGGDASFENLTVENLTVNNTANLPENTLIQPIWYSLVGSDPSNPFFNTSYPELKQYKAIFIDTTVNPISSNDWITIARVGEDVSGNARGRADALFKLSYPNSGRHETITFTASFKYSRGLGINVLHHDWYSGPDFSGLRIAYNGTYHGAVLQLQFTDNLNTAENALTINILNNEDYPGWNQYTDVCGTIVRDGIGFGVAIPDNNPQSLNTYGGNTVSLTNYFVLSDLSWNPSNTNTNQITSNPSKFIKEVDILEDTHIYKNLHVDKSISQRDCVTGTNSVAFGVSTDASGESSFSHGNNTVSSGPGSHAEGLETTSKAFFSHAEGRYSECISGANFSHAEGYNCQTYGVSSHAEGENCEAHGQGSHASGRGTVIGNNSNGGTSMGTYNDTSQNVLLVVGDGTSHANRSDAMTILTDGNARFYNDLTVDGNLIVQDNNYLQIFKSEPFDQINGNIPLAQILIPFTGILAQSIDSIAHANFEIIVKNNGLLTHSDLHHIISGNVSISIIYDSNTNTLDDNVMINIIHSSYSGNTPLIKRIFIEQNGGPNLPNFEYNLIVEIDNFTLNNINFCEYLEFKLKDNNRNNNNAIITPATQSINIWKINSLNNALQYAQGTLIYEINVASEKTYTCLGADKVDIKNELYIQNINQLKTLKQKFYSTNFQIQQGVPVAQTGYYKFAEVDNLRTINPGVQNLAELLTQGKFNFFTRLNIEDGGTNTFNKLNINSEFIIGIHQSFLTNKGNNEGFINTNYCLTQNNTPFKGIYIYRNYTNNKYELYFYYQSFSTLNKVLDLTITLQPGNENYNPIPCDLSGNISYQLNWELVDISYISNLPTIPGTNLTYDTTIILSQDFWKHRQELIWSGTTIPFIGESRNYVYDNNILEKYIFSQTTTTGLFDNDDEYILYCRSYNSNQSPFETSVNGTLRLFARDTAGPSLLHEIVANIGVQANGYVGNFQQEQTFLNILSNNVSDPGFHLIDNIKLAKKTYPSIVDYYVFIKKNQSITTKFELDIQLYNNDKNIDEIKTDFARFWTINKQRNTESIFTILKEVSTVTVSNIVTTPSTVFNNGAVYVNKLIPNGNGIASSFITETTDIIDNSIINNILSDGNHNIINKTISGGLVIDADTGANSSGGLKIFNSGGSYTNQTLASPEISLIPYKNSGGANTLGNPTIISVNDDESTTFRGSGNLSIYNGKQNFGSFNIWQGNGTTSLGSNVIQSAHLHHNEYRLSLNNSRNDTDVIINTPNYNDTSNNPAMIVDSGLNNITFHAPVNFENSVTVDGNSLSLIEEYLFNTSNIPPGNWFTLATTGDGSNRNLLRSDALFILEGRLGSHHHAIIFRAGAKFNSGIYINVLESSWYTTPRIQALRIAYLSTYDGSVLQAQLANGSSAQTTSNMTLRIYQNKNNAGWISTLTTSPSTDNNPVVYVTDNPSNPGVPYSNFRHSGNIIYDPHNRNTTQTTTGESYFENGNIYLKGGDVIVDGGVIDMSNGNINNINILDGNNSAGGTTTLRSNSSGIGSSSAYINFDSPIKMPSATGVSCEQSLVGANPATIVYNSDNNTLLYKPDSSYHPQTSNYLQLCGTAHPITMWDWVTNFKSTVAGGFTSSYNKLCNFSPWGYAPSNVHSTTSSVGKPLLDEAYSAPHSGYLSAVTFRFCKGTIGDIQITRNYGFQTLSASSKLKLFCRIKDSITSNITDHEVGIFFEGPGPGGALGQITFSAQAPFIRNFSLNPRTNLISFKKNDEINFNLSFINNNLPFGFGGDTIKIDVDSATTGNATVAGVIAYFHFYIES